ncbi:MAG: universal stress protein [Bacteroidales bacterium]|jgi:nucleotide-binding universal stress UspA family protein|nr:universal stress protein [Bacteroidales bacterium]
MSQTNQKKKYNNIILIPTDFSEVCGNAISHGVKLARFLGYKVCILHVINNETKAALKKKNVGVDYVDWRLKEYKKYYEKKYGIVVETMAVEGSIFSTITEVIELKKANLMILGTHGKKGLQHVFGSYALKVVGESPVPVVVVQKRSFRDGYQKIVFPVSNDLEPRQAVQWAKLMAKLFQSEIHLFLSREKDSSLNNRIQIMTKQITDIFDEEKIPYSITFAETPGHFAEQVISHSVFNHSDLILMITRPNVDIPGFSLSAWSERLMFNDAQIPVMCINPVDYGYYYYEWAMLT